MDSGTASSAIQRYFPNSGDHAVTIHPCNPTLTSNASFQNHASTQRFPSTSAQAVIIAPNRDTARGSSSTL